MPELVAGTKQCVGSKAANDLDAHIAGRPVNCVPLGLDRYSRTVAMCSVAVKDPGEWLVRTGLAVDGPQYSRGRDHEAQREAERAGLGLDGQLRRVLALSCMSPYAQPPPRSPRARHACAMHKSGAFSRLPAEFKH
ncbi:thermonuclease family protein [Bradyrhizobium sp. CB1650]|uniref:thermonuclease family protein n=1 Tax=Bradyrhizobium sp. CB1650 TaxID=3039153 RepID=UPI002434D6A0|nr:thermonuclease family protein [Bradyrhizobium sp. CB1650]WGD51105.1 thermonuclease family protein [Bradyrhizobium sp. CB1650]